MIVVKTINDEIVKQEISPANLKQFKRAGWVEFQEPKKVEKEPLTQEQVSPEKIEAVKEVVKNKGGRPKQIKE